MKFLKLLFMLFLISTVGGFAVLSFIDIEIPQEIVIKDVPAENFYQE